MLHFTGFPHTTHEPNNTTSSNKNSFGIFPSQFPFATLPFQIELPPTMIGSISRSSLRLHAPKQGIRFFSINRPKQDPIHIRLWNSYSEALRKRPLSTKCGAASIIFFTSDSATQYITNLDDEFTYNLTRAMSGAAFGVFATSYLHFWWGALERVLERMLPSAQNRISNTFFKVVIDQGAGAPFYVYTYYLITNFLQMVSDPGFKGSTEDAFNTTTKKAGDMLWPTMLRHWKVWPAVHAFNFHYVPLHHRVLVQNLVLVGWSGCKFQVF